MTTQQIKNYGKHLSDVLCPDVFEETFKTRDVDPLEVTYAKHTKGCNEDEQSGEMEEK